MKKSILSLVMALVMAISCISLAAAEEGPVSFEAKISADIPGFMALSGVQQESIPEETVQTLNAVDAILNAITLKGTAGKEAAELGLYAGDDLMLSIGAAYKEEGVTIASSLLGNQVFFLSAEMIQQLQQQMAASGSAGSLNELQNIDAEQLGKDVAEVAKKLGTALGEKAGEPEQGEFTVDGQTFTVKTPINITYAEASELSLNSVKELLGKDSMKALLKVFSQKGDPIEEIDKTIEKIKNQPVEEQPELSAAVYTDDKENHYAVVEMTRKIAATETEPEKETKIYYGEGLVDGTGKLLLTMTGNNNNAELNVIITEGNTSLQGKVTDGNGLQINFDLNADAAGNTAMNLAVKDKDVNLKADAKVEIAEEGQKNFAVELFANDSEKPLMTVTGKTVKGGEVVSTFEGEDITVIPFETLMNSDNAATLGQISLTATANLLKAVTVLAKNLPEEAAAWLNAQVKQMMTQGMPGTTVLPKAQ